MGITVGVAVSVILIILFCRTAQGTDMVGDTLRRQVDYDGIPASSGKEEEGEEEEPTAANTILFRCIGVRCSKLQPSKYQYGVVTDVPDCCDVCGRGPNNLCGEYGVCGKGFVCVKDFDPVYTMEFIWLCAWEIDTTPSTTSSVPLITTGCGHLATADAPPTTTSVPPITTGGGHLSDS